MKPIYVNNTYTQDNLFNGVAVFDKTVWKNLKNIYPDHIYQALKQKVNSGEEPFYSYDKYCQFVIYLQYQPVLGLSLKFIDFDNNIDYALDEYNLLKKTGWTNQEIEKIMKLFTEIKESNTETGEFIIEDQVLLS